MANGKENDRGLGASRTTWRRIATWSLFILSVTATIWVWRANLRQARERARTSFQQEMERSRDTIRSRLQVYEDALYGTRSIFEANSVVTREMFHEYISGLNIEERFPGVQAVAFSQFIPADQISIHIERVRAEGFSKYSIHPEGERPEYTSIVYIEPFDWRNQRAFGYDMFTEPVRHAAMEYARDNGTTSLSGKVKLVQETQADVQAGFLMYLPLYRKGMPVRTVSERRAALVGYVYSPFRMTNLMKGAIHEPSPLASFEIFSGSTTNPESLMYRSSELRDLDRNYKPLATETSEIDYGGQVWTLQFASLPALDSLVRERQNPGILPAGILISLLLFGVMQSLNRTEARALRMAEVMTVKLRETEERSRAITESAADAVISADSDGRITSFNAAATLIFGQSAGEALGKPLTLLMPERYHSAHQHGLERFLTTGKAQVIGKTVELVGVRKDGSEFPVSLSLSTFEAGGKTQFAGIVRDISEQQRIDNALRESEERYRSLFELNPHPVWVYDWSTLQFLTVNAAAIRDYGYSKQEFMNMTIKDIRPPDDVPALLKTVSISHEGSKRTSTWRHIRKDGQIVDVEISSYGLHFNDRKAELVIAVDITERKRAEEALRQSEERLRLLIDGVSDYAIYTLDPEGRVTSWNTAAERMKGYSAAEIIGQHFSRFHLSEEVRNGRPMQFLEEARTKGRAEDEAWRVRKDGTRFWADVIVTPLVNSAGQLVGFSKITRDLTERKRSEEQMLTLNTELELRNLELSSVNNELESFSYSVSHDLRAPVRAIDGFSAALLEDCRDSLSANGVEYLQRVRAATARMGQLIDDLLKLAGTARSKMLRESVDLSSLAAEIAGQLRKSESQRKAQFIIASGVRAEGDQGLLRILLENLLGNAWKFTSRTSDARIEFGVRKQGDQSICFVSDNGAGFNMKYMDKLFGAFQRLHDATEFPGTGIGLATVQRIIHRHGGQIWAESEVGKGATFSFIFPGVEERVMLLKTSEGPQDYKRSPLEHL